MAKCNHPFQGARKAQPTLKHRPAVWECMLGAVYALNDEGEVRYFDYDWDAARAWAGVADAGRDPRIGKYTSARARNYGPNSPRVGATVLWVVRGKFLPVV